MKWKLNSRVFMTWSLMILLFSACQPKEGEQEHSMEQNQAANGTIEQVISPNKQVLSRQATIKLQSGSNAEKLKAQGFIVPNPNRNQSVATRFSGRIEKLYIKFSNQWVKQGDKIMDIYSPGLRTYQEEYLFLLKSNTDGSLLEKSKEKLHLLGITNAQVAQLEKNGTVALTVAVFSPANGYVFFNDPAEQNNTAPENSIPKNSMGMQQNTGSNNSYSSSVSQIREGMYVNEGQTLFSVNDLQQVWALVSVPNEQLTQIHENQSVELVSENDPSKSLSGKVALIEKIFEDADQRFVRVRIVLPNPGLSIKINSLVTASFSKSKNQYLQVTASAVYKTGLHAYVWVKTGTTEKGTGIFKLRKVIATTTGNGMAIITSGLAPDEEIAKEAGLMTDSETFLTEN